jgi:hypothetical protein
MQVWCCGEYTKIFNENNLMQFDIIDFFNLIIIYGLNQLKI